MSETPPSFLVVDMPVVLDESAAGKSASAALQGRFAAAKAQHEKLLEQAKAASGPAQRAVLDEARAFEQTTLASLEEERRQKQGELIARARPLLQEMLQARGAQLVIERGAVLAIADEAMDVTAQLIARLDEG